MERSTSPLQGGKPVGIETKLDQYKADVLALPYAMQLADLTIAEVFIELGRNLERQALGIDSRPLPSRRRHLTLASPAGAGQS